MEKSRLFNINSNSETNLYSSCNASISYKLLKADLFISNIKINDNIELIKSDFDKKISDNSRNIFEINASEFNNQRNKVFGIYYTFIGNAPSNIQFYITDSISNWFFTTSETANKNLRNTGVTKDRIFFVGNTMIDTLIKNDKKFFEPKFWSKIGLIKKKYFVLTLHRPSNVDNKNQFKNLIKTIVDESDNIPIIFPAHPRTLKILMTIGIDLKNIFVVEPMSYLEFNYLVKYSKAVITDSGGITEEATIMNIPCITLRDSTERPETVEFGTNELVGSHPENLPPYLRKIINDKWKTSKQIPLWDGKTSDRIIDKLLTLYNSNDQ